MSELTPQETTNAAVMMLVSDIFTLHYWRFMQYPTDLPNVDLEELERHHRMSLRIAAGFVEKYQALYPQGDWEEAKRMFGADHETAFIVMKDGIEKIKRGEI